MKSLNQYINEKLVLTSNTKVKKHQFNYHPKTNEELRTLVNELIEERGNEADLNDIDTSKIDDMSHVFENKKFDGDISNWDVSNVKYMGHMFLYNFDFTGKNTDFSNWDVSNVFHADGMFAGCQKFEGKGLENWNVKSLKIAKEMFANCQELNFDITNWDVSNIEYFESMFINCKKFNQDLSNWKFNHNVRNLTGLFMGCESFEGKGLENWDVSQITNMGHMFAGCVKFNADISKWNVYPLYLAKNMFHGCKAFNQDLSNWDVKNLMDITEMFRDSGMTYNLAKWATKLHNKCKIKNAFTNTPVTRSRQQPGWYFRKYV
jgi:surface protein